MTESPHLTDPMTLFQQEAPEVAAAFNGLIQAIVRSKGLDEKTKQLIYIALKAADGDHTAVSFHVPMAKSLGASKAEVIDALLLTLTVRGISGVAAFLPKVVEIYG